MRFIYFLLIIFCYSGLGWADTYKVVEKSAKKGLVDEGGNTILPMVYDDLGWTNGIKEVDPKKVIGYQESGLWGILNLENIRVTKAKYNTMYPVGSYFLAGYLDRFSQHTLYGLLDAKGKVVLPFSFVNLWPVEGSESFLARKKIGNQVYFGVIDKKGKPLLNFQYPKIQPLKQQLLAVQNKEGKYALSKADGELLTAFRFDSLEGLGDQALKVYEDGMAGIIDFKGNPLEDAAFKSIELSGQQLTLSPYASLIQLSLENKKQNIYRGDSLVPVSNTSWVLHRGEMCMLVNAEQSDSSEVIYPFLRPLNENVLLTKQGSRMGLVSTTGEVLAPFEYDSGHVQHGFIIMSRNRQFMTVFNKEGKRLSAPHKGLKIINERYWAFQQGKYWGVTDTENKRVLYARYDDILEEHQGQFLVKYLGKNAVVNAEQRWIVAPRPAEVQWHHGLWFSKDQFGYKLINTEGKEVYFSFDPMEVHPLGFLITDHRHKIGLLDQEGKLNFFTEYDSLSPVGNGYFAIYQEGRAALLDDSGDVKIPFSRGVKQYGAFGETYIGAKLDHQYGFLDMTGLLRLANRYDGVGRFYENRAPVKMRGHWGFMNEREQIVVQPIYDEVGDFHHGYVAVKRGALWGLVNHQGKEVIPTKYDQIQPLPAGGFLVSLNGKQGFVNKAGQLRLSVKFDEIKQVNEDFLIIRRKGKFGVSNTSGIDLIPMIYQELSFDYLSGQFIGKQQATVQHKQL